MYLLIFKGVLFGIFTILSFYHLLIYFGRKYDYENLFYSLYCFCFLGLFFLKIIFNYKQNTFFSYLSDLIYIALIFLLVTFLILFSQTIFSNKTEKKFIKNVNNRILLLCHMIFFLFTLFTLIYYGITKEYKIISIFFISLGIYGSIFTVLMIYRYFYWKKYKNKKQSIFFWGFTILILYLSGYSFLLSILPIKHDLYTLITYIVILLHMILVAYALTDDFNKEHNDLATLKKSLEQKVSERIKQLKEANEQRTNFFIKFAHETKIPLTLLGNYLDKLNSLLRKKNTDIKTLQNLDIIMRNYEKIQRDIVNFLDIEKLKQGQMVYKHNTIIELKNYLEKKIELFQENAKSKKIKIVPILNTSYIKIDPYALDRIINNILDNAIKYNKENGLIKINLNNENEKIILKVKNTGIGIEKDHIKNIFKPFYQIPQVKNTRQGMGIGLNIVSQIITQIGGEIEVESIKNSGSTFTIIFPCAKKINKNLILNETIISKPRKAIKSNFLPEKYSEYLPTILIVEDNIEMLNFLQIELYEIFNIYCSENGEDALKKLENIPKPDIIISDIIMDKMNGFEFKNQLYEKKEYKGIPFIFLTAKATQKEKIQGFVKGAVSYITKPFNISELFVTISSIIDFTKIQKKINIEEFQKKISVLLNQSIPVKFNEENKFEYICYKNRISNTEKEIIKLILMGKEYKQIADELNKSFNTIRNQTQSIMKKFNIKNKKELINIFNPAL